jgi:hypothetical protein
MQTTSLSHKSPSTYGLLARLLDAEALSTLCQLFEKLNSHSQGEDLDVQRTPGASFNPRPARLLTLLCKEEGIKEVEVLNAAVILPFLPVEETTLSADTYRNSMTLAYTSRESLNLATIPVDATMECQQLCLVWLLDEIRHLHMKYKNPLEVSLNVSRIRRQISHISEAFPSRLSLLIAAHADRLERQL